MGVANGLSPNGAVTFGGATTNGTLNLAGNSQTVGGLSVAASATARQQIITNSARIGYVDLRPAADRRRSAAARSRTRPPTGVLALNVASWELVLSGNNTYAGGTTVSGGTPGLAVTNALAHGRQTSRPYLGSVLDLGGNGQTTSGTVSFQGGVVQNGTVTSTVAAFDGRSGTIAASLSGPVAARTRRRPERSSSAAPAAPTRTGLTSLPAARCRPSTGQRACPRAAASPPTRAWPPRSRRNRRSRATSGTVSIQGGTLQDGTLTSTSVAFDGQFGTITANLTGGVGLNKSTSGLLTLGGSSTYTGNTVVSAGTLQLGSAAGIPGGPGTGNVDLDGGAVSAGVVNINGFSPDFGGLSGAAGAVLGTVTNNSLGAGRAHGWRQQRHHHLQRLDRRWHEHAGAQQVGLRHVDARRLEHLQRHHDRRAPGILATTTARGARAPSQAPARRT